MRRSTTLLRPLVAAGLLMLGAAPTRAQDATPNRADALFDLPLSDLMNRSVTTGMRFDAQNQAGSALSVASFSADELRGNHGGSSDLNMVLRDLLPSFNYITEPLNDASSHVRAFTLRGLPGDDTLVLLNGKRFHRSALVQVGVNSPNALGSQGPDLGQLPVFGLHSVEVLRDGASAQYGSDAIAGVINLILPERAQGGEVALQRGTIDGGKGVHSRLSMQAGTRLGDKGFFNLTAAAVRRDASSVGSQRPDAAYYGSRGLAVADPAQDWGSPLLDARRLLWNARIEIGPDTQAYMFGNFSDADSDASFNYRALNRNFFNTNINTASGTLLACPAVAGDQFGYQAARNCLARAAADPALFNFQSVFPAGFTPRLAVGNVDFSQVLGIKGKLPADATFDLSASYARNRLKLRLRDTINPSFGKASPTDFMLGTMAQTEQSLNADLVWPMNAQLSLAAGAEWRQEIYVSEAGEPASRDAGPFATLGIGANGMPGIDVTAAGRFKRHNLSLYADSQYRLDQSWLLGAAARVEQFSDFGRTSNGKLSLRYLVNDQITLRGALGTGFRAPSPGQSHLTSVTHSAGSTATRSSIAGIIPPTSPIALFMGGRALEPEQSRNVSLGLAYRHTALSLTLDAFRISVRDRIALSNGLPLTSALRAQMRAAGIGNSDDYDAIILFNNAVDSVSRGVDLAAAYAIASAAGQTELKLSLSRLRTSVSPNGSTFAVNQGNLYNMAHQVPSGRASLAVHHAAGDWKASFATTFYGAYSLYGGAAPKQFPSKSVSNVELSLNPRHSKTWTLSAGVGNLFDTQAHYENGAGIGTSFITENPFEYEGRTYHLQARYAF